MRRGTKITNKRYLAAKMYHTLANITFGRGEKIFGVQKAPGGAKKPKRGATSLFNRAPKKWRYFFLLKKQ